MADRRPTAVGLVLVPFGALVIWGGISGTMAAILAALFAPSQLVPIGNTDKAPTLVVGGFNVTDLTQGFSEVASNPALGFIDTVKGIIGKLK